MNQKFNNFTYKSLKKKLAVSIKKTKNHESESSTFGIQKKRRPRFKIPILISMKPKINHKVRIQISKFSFLKELRNKKISSPNQNPEIPKPNFPIRIFRYSEVKKNPNWLC